MAQKFDIKYFVAGVAGGSVSSFVLHPLDLIKIRLSGWLYFYSLQLNIVSIDIKIYITYVITDF